VRSLIPTLKSGDYRFAGIYWRKDFSPPAQYSYLDSNAMDRLVVKLPVFVWHGKNYDPEYDRDQRGWWVLIVGFVWSRRCGIEWHAGRAAVGSQEVLNAHH
jgi:hypothetical protein